MARDRDRYFNRYELEAPVYQAPTNSSRDWAGGLQGVGQGALALSPALAATGAGLPAAGITAGIGGLALLGGALLGGSADEADAKAQEAFQREMLAYQQDVGRQEMEFLEKEAARKAKQDALLALRSRNIFV